MCFKYLESFYPFPRECGLLGFTKLSSPGSVPDPKYRKNPLNAEDAKVRGAIVAVLVFHRMRECLYRRRGISDRFPAAVARQKCYARPQSHSSGSAYSRPTAGTECA